MRLALSLLLLGAFGCEYEVERERPETRVMANDGACPPSDQVTAEERGEDADRTSWKRIELAPLCYYGVKAGPGANKFIHAKCDGKTGTLDDVRAEYAGKFAPKATGELAPNHRYLGCTDDGMVLVMQADGASCAAAEDAPDSWFGQSDDPAKPDLYVEELLAADARAPSRVCQYELTYEETRRPFSCGGARMGFAP